MIGDLLQGSLREEGVYDELSENGIDPRPQGVQVEDQLGDDPIVDRDDGDAFEEPQVQLVVAIDVDLAQLEREALISQREYRRPGLIAEMAVGAGVEDNGLHSSRRY